MMDSQVRLHLILIIALNDYTLCEHRKDFLSQSDVRNVIPIILSPTKFCTMTKRVYKDLKLIGCNQAFNSQLGFRALWTHA